MIQEVLYLKQIEEFEKHSIVEANEVHVSALVQCPMKWFYRFKYPDLARAQQYHAYMILGKLVHMGLQSLLMSLDNSEFKVIGVEVEAAKSINIERNGMPLVVRIKGRADMIIEDSQGRVIVEIKTARGDYNMPLQHHELQLRIYMNMLRAKRGLLLYITPDRIAEYPVDKPLDDYELQRLVYEFYQRSKTPKFDWECQYCQFNILCPMKKVNSRR